MKSLENEIMKVTNRLIMLLEFCSDAELVDEVCMNVSSCVPFDPDRYVEEDDSDNIGF